LVKGDLVKEICPRNFNLKGGPKRRIIIYLGKALRLEELGRKVGGELLEV